MGKEKRLEQLEKALKPTQDDDQRITVIEVNKTYDDGTEALEVYHLEDGHFVRVE